MRYDSVVTNTKFALLPISFSFELNFVLLITFVIVFVIDIEWLNMKQNVDFCLAWSPLVTAGGASEFCFEINQLYFDLYLLLALIFARLCIAILVLVTLFLFTFSFIEVRLIIVLFLLFICLIISVLVVVIVLIVAFFLVSILITLRTTRIWRSYLISRID